MANQANTTRRGCGCGTLVLGCLGVIVLFVVGIVAVGVFAWWQWTSTPDYWDEQRARIAQLTPEERDQRAEAVEHRISSWLSQANGADPDRNYAARSLGEAGEGADAPAEQSQSLSMSFDEVNAWLDRRLTGWMQQQEVDVDLPVRDLIITSRDGKLIVAGDVHIRQFNQVVSAVIDANLLADGDLHLHVERVRIGRVPLPSDAVVQYARQHIPDDEKTQAVRQALDVFEGTSFTPVYRIDNEREVRLVAWSVSDDGVELTIDTSPRSDRR
ncbi:hypothetical protein ACERK3_06910 [Phycisphaerales bacterium AB-hyl4]|uniref:Uncharacterized protein n=1 Tax=Natronomicrosphaera hydrolytica TaxID=3242702 RepID=A0ABV4U350_9BACT